MNEALNSLFTKSQPAPAAHLQNGPRPPNRIPIAYKHTYERDSFFELPSSAFDLLPQTVQRTRNFHHKLKLRVTTDQKTGKVLNKIIKARIADLNIYSPKTRFDWRLSINVEMPYDGPLEGLMPQGGGTGGPQGERNKDRLSYKHLAFSVDLTQVTPAEVCLVLKVTSFRIHTKFFCHNRHINRASL